jgi:hypothetical protein
MASKPSGLVTVRRNQPTNQAALWTDGQTRRWGLGRGRGVEKVRVYEGGGVGGTARGTGNNVWKMPTQTRQKE